MELKLSGFYERIDVYDAKINILDTIVQQNTNKQKSASMKSSVNMQACDNLIKTLSSKIEELENSNFAIKLE